MKRCLPTVSGDTNYIHISYSEFIFYFLLNYLRL